MNILSGQMLTLPRGVPAETENLRPAIDEPGRFFAGVATENVVFAPGVEVNVERQGFYLFAADKSITTDMPFGTFLYVAGPTTVKAEGHVLAGALAGFDPSRPNCCIVKIMADWDGQND